MVLSKKLDPIDCEEKLFEINFHSYVCVPDEFCEDYPHNLIPTPGYWIECSRQKISNEALLDDSDSDGNDQDDDDDGEGISRPRFPRDDSLLLEDDEEFEEEEEEPPPPR